MSSYLHEVVVPGDELEVRGPIGGWFVWRGDTPALLVGGGPGIVPLMSMLRLARRSGRSELVHLVVSVRSLMSSITQASSVGAGSRLCSRGYAPPSCDRAPGRIEAHDLGPVLFPGATAYVCGSSGFADHVTGILARLGFPDRRIRVERFGPSG